VLRSINLSIGASEKVLVAGNNGAGKTTLSKILSGVIPHLEKGASEGEYLYKEKKIGEYRYKDLVKEISILFQDFEAQIVSTSVREELLFYPLNIGLPYKAALARVDALCERFDVKDLLFKNVTDLSGGEKQKIALLSLLGVETGILLLDEPFTDIDPLSQEFILDFLRKGSQERTIVLFEQTLDYYEFFDRVIVLRDGEILYDGDAGVVADAELLEKACLGAPGICRVFPGLPHADISERIDAFKKTHRFDETACMEIEKEKKPASQTIIEVRGLSYRYKESNEYALRDIDLKIEEGDFISVLGANGSGKTTLMKLLAGILDFREGEILMRGRSAKGKNKVAGKVGYVYQNPDNQIFAETVFDEIAFILKMRKEDPGAIEEKVNRVMEAMGLGLKKDADPFTLPKGDRQKLACASIMVAEPDILILDEPTTGLDYPSLKSLMEIVRRINENGGTVLIVTHSMEVAASYGEKILVMRRGAISYYGEKRRLFADDSVLRGARLKRTEIMDLSLSLNGRLLLNEREFLSCWRER
jgi:energy-coupling factor transport system ATP-binding protein